MRTALVAVAVALTVAGGASGEVVARGVPDGLLAVGADGRPVVAYARAHTVFVSRRVAPGRWRAERVARVATGSTIAAVTVAPSGPVLLVLGPRSRSLVLIDRLGKRWRTTRLAGRLGPGVVLGWPGLAVDRNGSAAVAYARWRPRSHQSQLILDRIGPRGIDARKVTTNGWPASYVAPPAAPIIMPDGTVHVVETYGFLGTVGTIEWYPTGKTWTGQYLSGDQGDFPVGPMYAALGVSGVVYAAWTEATVAWDEYPVTLASHGRQIYSDFVFDRALTTGLALTRGGVQVAGNQWVSSAQLGLPGAGFVWAATISGHGGTELDGWISGLVARGGAEDLLLSSGSSLSWFRAASLPVRVALTATRQSDGSIALAGRVKGRTTGSVTIYRERPGGRSVLARATLSGGTFTAVDATPPQAALYRAVFVDPATGIPYAKLLRQPVG